MRYIISLIMISAGALKLSSFNEFVVSIYQFGILPNQTILHSAVLIISIELTGGFLLLFGVWKKVIALLFVAMLAIFTIVILLNIFQGRYFDCGCFGSALPVRIGLWSIIRNILLIAALIVVYRTENNRSG